MSWTSVPYCISPSDLAAVLSLVAANGSYPSIELSTKPATRESTVVMTSMPGNGSYWELRFFLRQDGSQLVEAFELRHGCFLQLGRCCPAMEIHTLGPTGGPLSLLGRVQYPAYLCPLRRTHPGLSAGLNAHCHLSLRNSDQQYGHLTPRWESAAIHNRLAIHGWQRAGNELSARPP